MPVIFSGMPAGLLTPNTSPPGTTSLISLWNGESTDGGKYYIIESLWVMNPIAIAVSATELGFWGMTNVGAVAQPAGAIGTIGGQRGVAYPGRGVIIAGATVVADVWSPVGTSIQIPQGTAAATYEAPVQRGSYVVPPGRLFSMWCTVSVSPSSSTVYPGIRWSEVSAEELRALN